MREGGKVTRHRFYEFEVHENRRLRRAYMEDVRIYIWIMAFV